MERNILGYSKHIDNNVSKNAVSKNAKTIFAILLVNSSALHQSKVKLRHQTAVEKIIGWLLTRTP